MATLEKIRSHSVLVLVIVGLGLLAFIIGDFFTSGRTMFGTGTTIAKVDGEKIDVQDFQRRVQEAASQAQAQGQQVDNAALQQQVLDGMIAERLFNKEVSKLGLNVSDSELQDVMIGNHSQFVDRLVQQQYGAPDAATFYDIAHNPDKYGVSPEQAQQYLQMWRELEKNVEQMLLQQKFQNLLTGTLTANDLDAKALYDNGAATARVVFAKKDFSTLPDDEYTVSDSEINNLYNKEKEKYALPEEVRSVSYIAVAIEPSEPDQLAGQQKVEDALQGLNSTPDLQGISEMAEFVADRRKVAKSDLAKQPRVAAAVDTLNIGSARLASKVGNEYTLVKLFGRSNEVTDITLDFIAVQGTAAQADSLVAVLNSGVSADSVSASAGSLIAGMQKDNKVSMLDPQFASIADLLAGRPAGVYFTPDSVANGQYARIFRIVSRGEPQPVVDLATITFTVEPSNATINELDNKLRNYVSANQKAGEFVANAQEAGYTTFPAMVSASSPMIGNLEDSHTAVAWVMEDGKKGNVSPVFGDIQSGRFLAVAINDIYDGGYMPARNEMVKNDLTSRVRNDKKAAKLMADYKGKAKDVAGYANLMGVSVDTTTVNFTQYVIPAIGPNESAITGKVANAKQGDLVGPVQGNNALVVLQVVDIDTEGRPYNREESALNFQRQMVSPIMNRISDVLRGNKKVTNNINVFYK